MHWDSCQIYEKFSQTPITRTGYLLDAVGRSVVYSGSILKKDVRKIVEIFPESVDFNKAKCGVLTDVPPLFRAIINTDMDSEMIEYLLQKGADPNAEIYSFDGCNSNTTSMIRLSIGYLKRVARVFPRSPDDYISALRALFQGYVVERTRIYAYLPIDTDRLSAIQALLLQYGANTECFSDEMKLSACRVLAEHGCFEKAFEIRDSMEDVSLFFEAEAVICYNSVKNLVSAYLPGFLSGLFQQKSVLLCEDYGY